MKESRGGVWQGRERGAVQVFPDSWQGREAQEEAAPRCLVLFHSEMFPLGGSRAAQSREQGLEAERARARCFLQAAIFLPTCSTNGRVCWDSVCCARPPGARQQGPPVHLQGAGQTA